MVLVLYDATEFVYRHEMGIYLTPAPPQHLVVSEIVFCAAFDQ